jgi:tRNA (uracil-5-)-methyltransferase TRM9
MREAFYNKNMDPTVSAHLIDINRQFYQNFGAAFAATRRRIQPGVRRVLRSLPSGGSWLDVGCGSGALAREWTLTGRSGSYLGLDFSATLLEEAHAAVADISVPRLKVEFAPADLSAPEWTTVLPSGKRFEGILAFAVLHHLPGFDRRRSILQQARELLCPGGTFIHSEWQFQHSERLLSRRQPWEAAGLNESDVEEGDTLLDWRFTLPGQPEQTGLRYVHLFTRTELEQIAKESGYSILEEFESDGEGGRLGLYQVWRAR